jgi:hypothetical protein
MAHSLRDHSGTAIKAVLAFFEEVNVAGLRSRSSVPQARKGTEITQRFAQPIGRSIARGESAVSEVSAVKVALRQTPAISVTT